MRPRAMAAAVLMAAVPVLGATAPAAHAADNRRSDAAPVQVMSIRPRGAHTGGSRPSGKLLSYRGGAVENHPSVYVVFWGSQWVGNDPSGEAGILESFYGDLGPNDHWSTSTTQYCSGVARGATSCGTAGAHIVQPASSPLLGYVFDSASAAPTQPTQSQLAGEAVAVATRLHAASPSLNVSAMQFVIATATGNSMNGFGTSWCAWHSSTTSSLGNIAYTNLPYMTDAGASCGANFVNPGPGGATDGVTIVAGHEYAETLTDQFPNGGWLDGTGAENGDKCAWIAPGSPGGAADVPLNGAAFPVQSLWSNRAGGCVINS